MTTNNLKSHANYKMNQWQTMMSNKRFTNHKQSNMSKLHYYNNLIWFSKVITHSQNYTIIYWTLKRNNKFFGLCSHTILLLNNVLIYYLIVDILCVFYMIVHDCFWYPCNLPISYFFHILCALSLWKSKCSEASVPAWRKILFGPAGWIDKNGVASYTRPRTTNQHDWAVQCFLISSQLYKFLYSCACRNCGAGLI